MGRKVGDGGRPAIRGTAIERVMRYVQFDPFGGCWLWDSGVTWNGHLEYPIFTLRPGKQQRVNRFMYEHHNGPIPPGLIVRHTCDVSLCINPGHLILGTHKQNAADRAARGRNRKPLLICHSGHPKAGKVCRECANRRNREYRERLKLAA